MRFAITREDIDKGHRMIGTKCPIARCIIRTCGELNTPGLMVLQTGFFIREDDYFKFPPHVTQRVKDYDAGKGMSPFSFDIDEFELKEKTK